MQTLSASLVESKALSTGCIAYKLFWLKRVLKASLAKFMNDVLLLFTPFLIAWYATSELAIEILSSPSKSTVQGLDTQWILLEDLLTFTARGG